MKFVSVYSSCRTCSVSIMSMSYPVCFTILITDGRNASNTLNTKTGFLDLSRFLAGLLMVAEGSLIVYLRFRINCEVSSGLDKLAF